MIEQFSKKIKEASEEMINEVISKGVLNQNDKQIQTISFVFWFCYMAETELNNILKKAWNQSTAPFTSEVNEVAGRLLNSMISGDRKLDINNLEYFADKIKVHEAMLGDNGYTKILWKINNIRNDLSHNRTDSMEYEKQSIFLRATKEKMILDYFKVMGDEDLNHSKIWNEFPEEQKQEIKKIYNEIIMNTLEKNFQNEMLNTYREAEKLGYKPTRFLQMINEYGAVETAKRLLASDGNLSDGVTKLWELGRLDLSMEAIVIKPEYKELFTEQEIKTAEKRLRDLGYIK